jgi:hypothetical protein
LDSPAKTEQQSQAAVTPASDAAAQETAARNIEAVTQSDAARQKELDDYKEALNQYDIDKAIYEQTYGPIDTAAAAPTVTPAAGATLDPQTITANDAGVSPVVTDLDLIKQVAAQPTPTVDSKTLEKVIVQGQGSNVANVAPVITDVSKPYQSPEGGGYDYEYESDPYAPQKPTLPPVEVTEKVLPPVEETKKVSDVVTDVPKWTNFGEGGGYFDFEDEPTTLPSLPPVEVVAKADELPEPGFEEYKPLPEEKVSDVVHGCCSS